MDKKIVEIITALSHRRNRTIQIGEHLLFFDENCVAQAEESLALYLLNLDESLKLVNEELDEELKNKTIFEKENNFLKSENIQLKAQIESLKATLTQYEADNKRLKEQILYDESKETLQEAIITNSNKIQAEVPPLNPPPPKKVSPAIEQKKKELKEQALIQLKNSLESKTY